MYPTDSTQQVSHETIYTAIYARPYGELRRQLVACLRQAIAPIACREAGAPTGADRFPTWSASMCARPKSMTACCRVIGKATSSRAPNNHSSVGVLVERTSRLVLLARMEDATAASALAGFSAKLNSIAAPLRQTFTYDQGKEMSRHQELTAATGVSVYFCDPHSPWQRGTCENTNGLLRQYLPKGTDLSVYSQDELDAIADSLNSRPRATHAFHSPFEVFAATLASASQPHGSKH